MVEKAKFTQFWFFCNFQNACPRKSSGLFLRNFTQLKYWRILQTGGVSASVLTPIPLAMTFKHGRKINIIMIMGEVDTVAHGHVLVTHNHCLAWFGNHYAKVNTGRSILCVNNAWWERQLFFRNCKYLDRRFYFWRFQMRRLGKLIRINRQHGKKQEPMSSFKTCTASWCHVATWRSCLHA